MGEGKEEEKTVTKTQSNKSKCVLRFLIRYWMIPCALFLIAIHLLCSFLGWRENTNILSGTGEVSSDYAMKGGMYVLSYIAGVVLAPILLIATLLQLLLSRILRGKVNLEHEVTAKQNGT